MKSSALSICAIVAVGGCGLIAETRGLELVDLGGPDTGVGLDAPKVDVSSDGDSPPVRPPSTPVDAATGVDAAVALMPCGTALDCESFDDDASVRRWYTVGMPKVRAPGFSAPNAINFDTDDLRASAGNRDFLARFFSVKPNSFSVSARMFLAPETDASVGAAVSPLAVFLYPPPAGVEFAILSLIVRQDESELFYTGYRSAGMGPWTRGKVELPRGTWKAVSLRVSTLNGVTRASILVDGADAGFIEFACPVASQVEVHLGNDCPACPASLGGTYRLDDFALHSPASP